MPSSASNCRSPTSPPRPRFPTVYIDPPTELIKDGETQIWKITHNGVDTHAIHFHLFNVQLINRVGWDGAIRPPDANEMGWKETVRMNPLEDAIVALQPMRQDLPWPIPDSVRPFDVTRPLGTTGNQFTNVEPANGNPVTTANASINYGWEYVWHCHLLGHEENDMMRPIVFQVPPEAPSNLAAAWSTSGSPGVNLTWTDNSATATGFTVQRAEDAAFAVNPTTFPVGPERRSRNGRDVYRYDGCCRGPNVLLQGAGPERQGARQRLDPYDTDTRLGMVQHRPGRPSPDRRYLARRAVIRQPAREYGEHSSDSDAVQHRRRGAGDHEYRHRGRERR